MTSTPPPFDPELAATLAVVSERFPDVFTLDAIIEMRREQATAGPSDEELSREGYFDVEERTVPGPSGAPDISLLICRPAAPQAVGPRPVLYHTHGGGMTFGNNRVGLDPVLDWARELEAVVVSVEYRLAPEHPYPAPLEDSHTGFLWTAEHAKELGGDPERIVVVGASAGGGLTASLALFARDQGGPQPAGQILLCPMLDDRDTDSARQLEGQGVWDRRSNGIGWTALLGERRGAADVPAHAAPARATDLSGLPPAFIDVGSAETFRDEAVAYASAIWRSGGEAELHVWPGGFHGYDIMAPHAALSQDTRAARVRWLRRLLGE